MPRITGLPLVLAALLIAGTAADAHATRVLNTTHNYSRPIIHNYAHHYRYHAPRSYHRRHHYDGRYHAPPRQLYRYRGFRDPVLGPYYGDGRGHYRHGRHFKRHRRYGHGYGYGFGYRLPGLSLHYRGR